MQIRKSFKNKVLKTKFFTIWGVLNVLEKKQGEAHARIKIALVIVIILIFAILGIAVYFVAQNVSSKMARSAIDNLSGSLNLVKGTVQGLMEEEAEFQKLIASELSAIEDIEGFVQTYDSNKTISKISIILDGMEKGISNTGEDFSADDLDFSAGKLVNGLEVSTSYVNHMGTWAYTFKCPVVKDGKEIATLYAEFLFDAIEKALPEKFYNDSALLYVMDAKSERFVIKPRQVGVRTAGHLNLTDFYRANVITDENIHAEVADCIRTGQKFMFYHDVQGQASLIYMWPVNNGALYLAGFVPIQAIQQEGNAVNQSILIVVLAMISAFLLCCALYFFGERQQAKARKEREAEREQMNAQLMDALQASQIANHSKTVFLSSMSHDIRTPMNAILGFATLLEKDAEIPAKVREYTGKITASGKHLLGLINDVLDMSKIESGKVVLTIGKFSLDDMIAAIDAIIRPMAADKAQDFEIEVTGVKHGQFEGDETRINQVLLNLLSNAVKYTQSGGNIRMRIIGLEQHSHQYEHIRIEVEDNGFGMTPEYLKIIFDPFTRAENSTTNKVQGTGLGMAITKSIVELMGGSIAVSSEVGKGTLFTVELELRISEEEKVPEPNEAEPARAECSTLQGHHFLVAEDNEVNADIFAALLEMEGATCEIVENGCLALERFKASSETEFDAILMDIQMPEMNGYDAARAIRALDREDAKTIPIIAMTANAFVEDVRDAMEAGMNGHIAKPIDMAVVREVIGKQLRYIVIQEVLKRC